jgi:hypothetical protein
MIHHAKRVLSPDKIMEKRKEEEEEDRHTFLGQRYPIFEP